MAIQGQNLRVLIGDQVIAGATTCTLHVAASIANRTSKDSPDGWDENQCVSTAWDVSADAFVFAHTSYGPRTWNGSSSNKVSISSVDHFLLGTASDSSIAITLKAGDRIMLEGSDVTGLAVIDSSKSSVLKSGTDAIAYTNSGSSAMTVYVAAYGTDHTAAVDVFVKDATDVEDLLAKLIAGTTVTLKFASMSGSDHRTAATTLRQGTAIVEDITINAANRDLSTYTVKFKGTGALSVPTT